MTALDKYVIHPQPRSQPSCRAPPTDSDLSCCRRTLGAAAAGAKHNVSELHRTYDNLNMAYSTEVGGRVDMLDSR